MSRAATLVLVGLISVAGCRDGSVVAPPATRQGTPLANGHLAGQGVASGYVAVDLGPIPFVHHGYVSARAINNSRQIVGRFLLSCFLWQNSTLTDMGAVSGQNCLGEAVSDNGTIVGQAFFGGYHAAMWNGSTFADLGTLGGVTSWAKGVNDAGQVTGISYATGQVNWRGFVWQNGTMTDLGSFGGEPTYANAINASGQIVGASGSFLDANFPHPFVWENGVMSDLGGVGEAYAINATSAAVGEAWVESPTAGHYEAAIWQNNTRTLLGVLLGDFASRATGINSIGQIVGTSSDVALGGGGVTKAFLWENGVMSALPDLGGGYTEAFGINDAGDIVGQGITATNETHAVLWTKNPPNRPPTAVAGGPYTGTEGTAVVFNGSGSSDPDAQALTYDWDFGDGTAHGTGVSPSHSYADNGSYNVTLTVSDGVYSHAANTTSTVANVAPAATLTLQTAPPIHAGQSFVVRGGFHDVGLSDGPWGYQFFRNNTLLQQGTKASQPPPGVTQPVTLKINTVGTYTLKLQVTDKDGGVGIKSIPVQIVP